MQCKTSKTERLAISLSIQSELNYFTKMSLFKELSKQGNIFFVPNLSPEPH